MNQVFLFISKYKVWIIIIVVLIVLISAIYYVNKKDDKQETVKVIFPLKKGSSGEEVIQIQKYLLANNGKLPKYGVDGIWGSETDIAVISVLKVNEINESLYKSLIK